MPLQVGVQLVLHAPVVVLQICPLGHVPQLPPHRSGPQVLPAHLGLQLELHWPLTQACPEGQLPQLVPHPSSPHFFPLQFGTHASTHAPSTQNLVQAPQEFPQPSSPQFLPLQEPAQVC